MITEQDRPAGCRPPSYSDTRVAFIGRAGYIFATEVAEIVNAGASMSDRQSGRRGRPRDSAVDSRVLDAAWDLLYAKGFAGLTVDEVAERAGTAKTTVYRRWPTKDHLAVALAARILGEVPIADTGDLRADLTGFAVALAGSLDRLRLAGNPAGRRPGWPPNWPPPRPGTPTSASWCAPGSPPATRWPRPGCSAPATPRDC